jgi:hypothetical protein
MTDLNAVKQLYPQCVQAGVDPATEYAAVRATVKGNGLGYGSTVRLTFGMALWLAIVIHVIGVEVYVRMIKRSALLAFTTLILNSGFLDPTDGIFESTQARICLGAGRQHRKKRTRRSLTSINPNAQGFQHSWEKLICIT